MQITTGEILEALPALQALVAERMPVATAMRVRRVARALAPLVDDYNAERQKLIEQYAVLVDGKPKADERGNVSLADGPGFQAAHGELLAVAHEVEAAIPAAELEESGINVEPRLLIGLGPLVAEE